MKVNRSLIFGIILLFVVAFGAGLAFYDRIGDSRLAYAEDRYLEGIAAKTVYERERRFNEALDLYLSLENEYHPAFGNGKLYYNIGNIFFELGEYPRAILYYERSKALMPRGVAVKYNLALARSKLGLPSHLEDSVIDKVFYFHYYLSLPERLQLFFCLSIIFLILISWRLWSDSRWVRRCLVLSTFSVVLMGSSLVYTRYFSPLEGILIQPVVLRQDGGTQYPKLSKEPILAGEKVEVIGKNSLGTWLKIIAPSGQVGFIEQTSLSIIH